MPAVVAVTIPLNLQTIRLPSPNPDKVDLLKVPRHLWPHGQRIGLLYHLTQRLICDVFTYWDDVIMLTKIFSCQLLQMQYPIHNKIHFSLQRAIDDAETEKTATPIDKYHIPHSICVVADRQRAQRIETRVVRNLLKISKSNAKCQISNWLSHFWCFVPEK